MEARSLLHASLMALVTGFGCSSSSDGAPAPVAAGSRDSGARGDVGVPRDAAAGGDVATEASAEDSPGSMEETPVPCGVQVGDTLCDVDLEGYANLETSGLASAAPYESFRIADVMAKGTQRYGYISLSAWW